MKRIIRLTESDLTRIVRRVLSEQTIKVGNTLKGKYQDNAKGLSFTVTKLNKLPGCEITEVLLTSTNPSSVVKTRYAYFENNQTDNEISMKRVDERGNKSNDGCRNFENMEFFGTLTVQ